MNEQTEAQRGPVLFLRPKAASLTLAFQLEGVLETTKIVQWCRTGQTTLPVARQSRSWVGVGKEQSLRLKAHCRHEMPPA